MNTEKWIQKAKTSFNTKIILNNQNVRHFISVEEHEENFLRLNLLTIDHDKKSFFSYLEKTSENIPEQLKESPDNGWTQVSINLTGNDDDFLLYAFNLEIFDEQQSPGEDGLVNIPTLFQEYVSIKVLKKALPEATIEEIESFVNDIDLSNYELTKESEISRKLRMSTHFNHVEVLNVGQGNLNSVCCRQGITQLYFDLGGEGKIRKGFATKRKRKLCFTNEPPVILSHWDEDHYSQLLFYANQVGLVLCPSPDLKSQAQRYVVSKLLEYNKLSIITSRAMVLKAGSLLIIRQITHRKDDRNNNSLVLVLKVGKNKRRVLLPGDVDYYLLPEEIKKMKFYSVVASHHGGTISTTKNSFYPTPYKNNHRLVFSHGRKRWSNKKQHPYSSEVAEYKKNEWKVRNIYSTFFGDIIIGKAPYRKLCKKRCDTKLEVW